MAAFNVNQPILARKLLSIVAGYNRVPTLLVKKNPGLFQDFPGPHKHFSRTLSHTMQ